MNEAWWIGNYATFSGNGLCRKFKISSYLSSATISDFVSKEDRSLLHLP